MLFKGGFVIMRGGLMLRNPGTVMSFQLIRPLITNAHHHPVSSGARHSKFQLQIPRNNTPVSAMSDYAHMRSCSLGLTSFITQQPS